MTNIIFIAPPAAGKGTQSKLMSLEYNIPHISTGDLLRDEVEAGTMLGKFLKEEMDLGNLISDDIIVNLLRKRICRVDCNDGYILDGYPRNVEQAKIYENLVNELGKKVGIVIHMDVDKEVTFKRTINRIICGTCGTSYNKAIKELSPTIDGICDKCGHILTLRSDDNESTFVTRYNNYEISTTPLLNYYREKGILKEFKVEETDTVQDIFNKIKELIN